MKNLIKPMKNEDFLSPKVKNCSKMIKDPLPTQRFRNAFPKRQKPYKPDRKRGFYKCRFPLQNTL